MRRSRTATPRSTASSSTRSARSRTCRGTTTALFELALALAQRGDRVVVPDPGYPDYTAAVAFAGAEPVPLPLGDEGRPAWDAAPRERVAALHLNYPTNPAAFTAPEGVFAEAVAFARETDAAVVHDFAYADFVFDGRRPRSFLAELGAREVGVELFSLSKSYGMAGWRLGYVVGNAELVARANLLSEHLRAGILVPLQRAAVAALRGPQEAVAERRALYAARRARVLAALAPLEPRCEGSFFAWFRLSDGVTVERLLVEARVGLAPGEGFGARGRGHARISLATTDATLDLGLERLRTAFHL